MVCTNSLHECLLIQQALAARDFTALQTVINDVVIVETVES